MKYRAMRLETGNFAWGSETVTKRVRVLDVVYNASNNELVRTKTLVKNAIVLIDASPFKEWYQNHYGLEIGKKKIAKKGASAAFQEEMEKKSDLAKAKLKKRQSTRVLSQSLDDQFSNGRLLAAISSRPDKLAALMVTFSRRVSSISTSVSSRGRRRVKQGVFMRSILGKLFLPQSNSIVELLVHSA